MEIRLDPDHDNEPNGTYCDAALDCADELTSLLSEMGDGWISVGEGLPGIGIPVLVTGHEGEGHMETANFAGRDDEGYFEWDHGNGNIFYHVTHWQPLPEGPKR